MNILDKIELSNKSYKAKTYYDGCLASTSSNILFSCFSQGTQDDQYILKVLRSDDNGITWKDTNFPVISNADHNTPCMIIDSGNVIHIVLSCPASLGGNYRIYYVSSNTGGETWSTPVVLQPLNGYDQFDPKIVFDKRNNRLNVVWYGTDAENNKTQIKFCNSTDGGRTWSQYKNIARIATEDQLKPQMTIDSTGSIYVFWHGCDSNNSHSQVKFTKSIDYGNSWLKYSNIYETPNYDQSNVDGCIDTDDNVYIAWQQKDNDYSEEQIRTSKTMNGGANWSTPVVVTNSKYEQRDPEIVYNEGATYIFWKSFNDTTINRRIKFCKTEDYIDFTEQSYLTAECDDVESFSIYKYCGYLLLTYESFLAVYMKKYGYRKYLFQNENDIYYSKYEVGTEQTTTTAQTNDNITYSLNTQIKNNSVKIYDINKTIDSTLYKVTDATGDVVFTDSRTGNIKFIYSYIDVVDSNTIKDATTVVTPEADGKTYKLNCKLNPGSLKAIEVDNKLVNPSEYNVNYLYGNIIFNDQKSNSVEIHYTPIIREWEKIGTTPVTNEMFEQYGHDEITWITYERMEQLSSKQPYIIFIDKGMEYVRPSVVIKGDALSKYRYQVTMDEKSTPLKNWTDYIAGATTDSVVVKSSYLKDSEPKNINVNIEQYDDKVKFTRSGTVTLNNNAPIILAQINGMRLNLTVKDIDGDRVCYNIYANGKKVYPLGSEYTDYLTVPSTLAYIFKSDEIKIDEDNIIVIKAKDQYGKASMVRLDFVGQYAGLIFMDSEGNRYSTDDGLPLQILDMGTIQAGSESNIYPVHLKNSNGFDVKNISIWGDGIIKNGNVKFSKTLSPFTSEDNLTYSDVLLNESEIVFYIKVMSKESIEIGGGNFRVLAKAEAADVSEITQQPAPDPGNTVTFNITDANSIPLPEVIINFNDEVIQKTNVMGRTVYKNVPIKNGIEYSIVYNGYKTVTGTVDVVSGDEITIDVKLELLQSRDVKFIAKENDTLLPNVNILIKGQKVQIGENSTITYPDLKLFTNYDGEVSTELVPATYEYEATMNGYVKYSGSFTLNDADETVDLSMEKARIVTMIITNGSNPVEYANVHINNSDLIADYSGKIILGVGPGEYPYTIVAEDYEEKIGTVKVENDNVTENVVLTNK